jgi:hypothetical protein
MPFYDYECGCGATVERQCPVGERDLPRACVRCGATMYRKLAAPMGRVDKPAAGPRHNYADEFTRDMTGLSREEIRAGGLHTPEREPK